MILMKQPSKDILDSLIGKTYEEAQELCDGYRLRVTNKDGVAYVVTCDFRLDRINVELDNGIVTFSSIG